MPRYSIPAIQRRANKRAGRKCAGLRQLTRIQAPRPLRTLQLCYRQSLFAERTILRIGELVPTYDFNNVARPVPTHDSELEIPAVNGLFYAPIFVNPTFSALSAAIKNRIRRNGVPSLRRRTHIVYGFYDGNVARGAQTGLMGRSSTVITSTSGRQVLIGCVDGCRVAGDRPWRYNLRRIDARSGLHCFRAKGINANRKKNAAVRREGSILLTDHHRGRPHSARISTAWRKVMMPRPDEGDFGKDTSRGPLRARASLCRGKRTACQLIGERRAERKSGPR